MKCSNCGKSVSFFLAYKVKGASGYYCSCSCAQDANADAFTSRADIDRRTYRGGFLELFCFFFMLPWWIFKLMLKIFKPVGRIACKIMFHKWTVTIFTFGMAWAAWKILDKIYGDN